MTRRGDPAAGYRIPVITVFSLILVLTAPFIAAAVPGEFPPQYSIGKSVEPGRFAIDVTDKTAVSKGGTALLDLSNQAVEASMRTGESNRRIFDKWQGESAPFWTVHRVVWMMGLITVFCIAVMLIWRYGALAKISLRLALGFALVILLLALVVVNGIKEMNLLSSQTVMVQRHPLTVSNAVLRVNTDIIKIHRSMKDVALARDNAEIEKSARIVESLEKEVYRNFKVINERFLGEKELVKDAERIFKAWKPVRDEVISLMHAGKYREAAGITKGKGALHVVKIEKAMEALGDFAQGKSENLLSISEKIKSRAFNTMYLLFVITLGTGIIVSFFITKSITRPIVTLKDAMLKIGEGELDQTVEIKSADEIGQLAESLNKMTANLKRITASRDELNEEITERKRAEDALRDNEKFLNSVLDGLHDGISVVGRKFNILHTNGALKQFFPENQSRGGLKCFEVFHGRTEPCENCTANKTFRTGTIQSNTVHLSDTIGEPNWVEETAFPIKGKNGSVSAVIINFRDITERKRAEVKLRSAKQLLEKTFASLSEAVFVVNPESRTIIAVNPAVERLFGYGKEELAGRGMETVHVDRSSYEEFLKSLSACLEKSDVCRSESRMRKKDGTVFLCDHAVTEIRDESGKRTELVCVFTDITEKRLIEQELLKAQKLESLSLLAGGIAHDFNNILMGILGNISLAKFLNRSEKKPLKILEEAEKAAIRARGLTSQLLTFSTGGTPFKNVANIKDLLTEISQFALRGSKSKAVNILDENLATVNVDRDQVTQVFNNLLINADQAMPEGGTITMRGENITLTDDEEYNLPGGQYVKISVEDSGVGISPDIIDIIFDPFFTTKSDGSGLGLSTSYSIIKNHGGLLKVTSRPGDGSTFHIYLPAADKPVPPKNRDRINTRGSGKILVMDDDELVRNVLAEMLSVLGYQSELARDGEEAEKKYTEAMQTGEHYAAVILDLTVRGGMGGRQAMEKLKEIDPNVNAIVASGYSTDVVVEDYSRFGFSGYVTKPFELKTLSKVLSKTIRSSGHTEAAKI